MSEFLVLSRNSEKAELFIGRVMASSATDAIERVGGRFAVSGKYQVIGVCITPSGPWTGYGPEFLESKYEDDRAVFSGRNVQTSDQQEKEGTT
jgi:hypothetical protein